MFSTIQPRSFESAIKTHIRKRAWVFSAASPKNGAPKTPSQVRSKAVNASVMGHVSMLMPRFSARSEASRNEDAEENGPGMRTPCTWPGPSASEANAATTLESRPPESPMSTSVKPAPRTKSAVCWQRDVRTAEMSICRIAYCL